MATTYLVRCYCFGCEGDIYRERGAPGAALDLAQDVARKHRAPVIIMCGAMIVVEADEKGDLTFRSDASSAQRALTSLDVSNAQSIGDAAQRRGGIPAIDVDHYAPFLTFACRSQALVSSTRRPFPRPGKHSALRADAREDDSDESLPE